MNSDILECKKKAKEMVPSKNPLYYTNGRKKGYIEVMKVLWEEKGYGYLELKSQNLRDRASRLEKLVQDRTAENENRSLADRNEGEPMSSQREVFEENIQSSYQNKVPRQAEYANFASSLNFDLHTSMTDGDLVNQENNEVNQTITKGKAQFNQTFPITRCSPLKSRTKHGAISITRASVIPSIMFTMK